MKSQVLHTVWCNISSEAAGGNLNWSLLGVKGLSIQGPFLQSSIKLIQDWRNSFLEEFAEVPHGSASPNLLAVAENRKTSTGRFSSVTWFLLPHIWWLFVSRLYLFATGRPWSLGVCSWWTRIGLRSWASMTSWWTSGAERTSVGTETCVRVMQ